MLGILTEHPNDTFTPDDLAFVTHPLDGRSDFHDILFLRGYFYFARYVILPRVRSYGDNSTVTLSPGRILM